MRSSFKGVFIAIIILFVTVIVLIILIIIFILLPTFKLTALKRVTSKLNWLQFSSNCAKFTKRDDASSTLLHFLLNLLQLIGNKCIIITFITIVINIFAIITKSLNCSKFTKQNSISSTFLQFLLPSSSSSQSQKQT